MCRYRHRFVLVGSHKCRCFHLSDRIIFYQLPINNGIIRINSNNCRRRTDRCWWSKTGHKAPVTEIDRRRNLAIISHPDSGKTTMTEKLLLYGGALQQAGAVRHKAEQRATQSDFMAMEQERGISISSTVMNFDYQGYRLNILDTPGHQE